MEHRSCGTQLGTSFAAPAKTHTSAGSYKKRTSFPSWQTEDLDIHIKNRIRILVHIKNVVKIK